MTAEALASPPERGWMTAGELRAALATLPDDAPAFVDGHPDRSIAFAFPTQQIHPDDVESWEKGDRLVRGLEVWVEDIDDPDAMREWPDMFGDRRCRHGSNRPPSTASVTEAREALGRLCDQAGNTAGDYAGRQRVKRDSEAILRILEARRRAESPCGQVAALSVGRLSGPCVVLGRHTDHRADNGDSWTESVR